MVEVQPVESHGPRRHKVSKLDRRIMSPESLVKIKPSVGKLAGPSRDVYFGAYVMIDIYSLYIVGAVVHAHESGHLAVEMTKEIFGIHGSPQVVQAGRGTSMISKTVAALLSDLEVARSHPRPKVSIDDPYSEA